jgi:hypothetical protein
VSDTFWKSPQPDDSFEREDEAFFGPIEDAAVDEKSDADPDRIVPRAIGGQGGSPRQIARDAAADMTRLLVSVAQGKGGRNAAARVTAAMRVLELAGVLEEQPHADTTRTVVVAADQVGRAAELLRMERETQKRE